MQEDCCRAAGAYCRASLVAQEKEVIMLSTVNKGGVFGSITTGPGLTFTPRLLLWGYLEEKEVIMLNTVNLVTLFIIEKH